MKLSLLVVVTLCVTASLDAKKTSSTGSSLVKPKREASLGSSYHGPSYKYLPPSPAVSGSGGYNSYSNSGYDFGGSSPASGAGFHGNGGSGGVFSVRGLHSHGRGNIFGSGPKVETYLVRMEHGGGAGSGLGAYKYSGPSYSSGGSPHSAGSFGSGNFGGHHGGHSSLSPSSSFPSPGYKVHSVVVPVHTSNDGSYSGGSYNGHGGFSSDHGGSSSGHGFAFGAGGHGGHEGGFGGPSTHSFGVGFGNGGHSGGSGTFGYQYPPVSSSSSVSDHDSSEHPASLGATLVHGPSGGHGVTPNLGYAYETPADSSFLHSAAAATTSPAYAMGHKGLGHYNSYTLSKPHQRHTDIFASSHSKAPFEASAFLGGTHEPSGGSSPSYNSLQSDEYPALAPHYLPPHQGSDESGFGAPSGSYLPPSNSYGAPLRH